VIDFHCHLDLYPDPVHVADECRRRGLYILSVTTTPSAWSGTYALSRQGDRIRTALGLHPQLAHERHNELPLFDALLPQTQYVGEVGLDGAPDFRAHSDLQLKIFNHILTACREAGGRIMSIHSRRAVCEVLDSLARHPEAGTPILHWFSGSRRDLDRAIAMGCWFSVGPAMLRSERGRALAVLMPRDRVLTESDGPFAQINGQAVVPWQVEDAVESLAVCWGTTAHETTEIIRTNLRNLAATTRLQDLGTDQGN